MPTTPSTRFASATLLAALTRRAGQAAQELDTLSIAEQRASESVPDHDPLQVLDEDARGLGFALGVLSCATGAEELSVRHEADGLEPLVALVDDALRAEGRRLAPRAGQLPELVPGVGHGWELPWACACALYGAGRACAPGTELGWNFERHESRWQLLCCAGLVPAARAELERLARSLEGLHCASDELSTQVELPGTWLRERRSP